MKIISFPLSFRECECHLDNQNKFEHWDVFIFKCMASVWS